MKHPKGKVNELDDLIASLPFHDYEALVSGDSDHRVKHARAAEQARKRIAELQNGSATPEEAQEGRQDQTKSQVQELPGSGRVPSIGPERIGNENSDPNRQVP